MNKHPKSILSALLIPYTTLFLIAFIAVSCFFIVTEARRIEHNSFLGIENNLNYTMDSFDQVVDSLNTTSQNIYYSNLVKSHFASYLGYAMDEKEMEEYTSLQNTKILYDLLITIIGPNMPVDQIYLYGLDAGTFGVGRDNSYSSESVTTYDWYPAVSDSHGEKYVFLNKDDRLTPYSSYSGENYFLSLCRNYYDSRNVPQGIIEVKKSITPLVSSIESYHLSCDEAFYILGPEGQIVYPLPEETSSGEAVVSDYFSILQDTSIPCEILDNSRMKRHNHQYIFYQTSSYSGFTTIAVVEQSKLMAPIYHYLLPVILILLLICGAIVVLSYFITQRISRPLGQIYSQINSFQVNSAEITDADFQDIQIPIIELDGLYQALLKMQSQTRASLEHELELQNREMQSRMLALQAQMNPHFLYNSLAVIQAMADENMTDEIYYLCQNISDILRYISSDSDQLVSLSDEIRHTVSYLECMKMRYDNQLTYLIDIPEEMNSCKIPKLCLQLIVENAIKFTTKKRSPWEITITGHAAPPYWEIHITDNGPGFSDEVLSSLQQKIRQIDETGVLPNLEISGMGLMNIYIRFKLLYKGFHVFQLRNNYPEGARVTIGGTFL